MRPLRARAEYLVCDPDIEMVEAKASDMDDQRGPCGEPQPPTKVIPPEHGSALVRNRYSP